MKKTIIMKSKRERAIELVEHFLDGGFETEEKDDQALVELHNILPDPEFERFLFWGPEGPIEDRYKTLTAEEIVDEAMSHHPIDDNKNIDIYIK